MDSKFSEDILKEKNQDNLSFPEIAEGIKDTQRAGKIL